MQVALFRIDDRLIHGQVVEAWVPYLKAEEIVVVSDEIAADELRRTIMRFSTPEGVSLTILPVAEALIYLSGDKGGRNALVLLPGLKEAADMISRGLPMRSLNIGGMHYSAGKNFSIGKAIFLSEEDRGYLKSISAAGVELEGRGVPTDKPINLMEAIAR
jgi:mannose/fructose/N-acetylgalactosamine-specific phosphotransferase system component IIB